MPNVEHLEALEKVNFDKVYQFQPVLYIFSTNSNFELIFKTNINSIAFTSMEYINSLLK
jgi:hypothetical protein